MAFFVNIRISIPPGVDGIYDPEGDTVYLEELLSVINSDPNLPPSPVCEINVPEKVKSSCEDPPDLELKDLPSHLEMKRLIKFCTHKILMEENAKPVVQHQRRVNPKIHEVIKQEVIKLLDAGLIYLISDSPWILIDPLDQEKTTFTCPYGTFAYRRMPFGLCNAPGTFQRCMVAIFHDMIEKTMEVFMDDFSVYGDSFSSCLSHLDKMLQSCERHNLDANWEKCHFMVKEGIVLGHKISKSGIEVDKAKVDVIAKLPHPHYREGSILVAPDWDIPLKIMCDASDFAVGASPRATISRIVKTLMLAVSTRVSHPQLHFGNPERISKKRTKNEAKKTKPDTEWKSVEKTQSNPSPIEFRVDLVPGATPVAKSPYRLAPLEMQELSEQLQELQDEEEHGVHLKLELELLRKEKLYAKSSVKDKILATSSETSKVENAPAEMLRDLDQQMEKRADDGKANVVTDALSRKERVKPRRVRAMAMIIQYGVRGMILAAQSEAFKQENGMMRTVVMDEAHASRLRWMIYLVVLADAAESVRDTIGFEYCLASSSGWTKSSVLWAEIGESSLTRPELVLDMKDKVVLVKEKLKAARDRQKSYADNRRKHASLHVLLDEIKVDKTLRFVEEPVENSDREVKRLKCSRMVVVKVHLGSKRGHASIYASDNEITYSTTSPIAFTDYFGPHLQCYHFQPMFDSRLFFPPLEDITTKDAETPVESPTLISPSYQVGILHHRCLQTSEITSVAPAMTQAAIRQLVVDSIATALEAHVQTMAKGKCCEKNYSSVRRYVADLVNAYPKQSITKLIPKGAVKIDVVSYQFRCALNYSKLDEWLKWGKCCQKNYSSVRRYVADPVNAYPKRSITKLILKGAVIFDVVSYQFRCALNYSKLKCMGYLARAYYSISSTKYYKDDSCWSADLKSNTTEDVISI
ncbi:reverse transcriptase domain-containing protein [Tanacetum coccineum]